MFTSGWSPEAGKRRFWRERPKAADARLLAEMAQRQAGTPLLHVALDDTRAAILADALAFFAPHCEVVTFPAWDCLPYDRVLRTAISWRNRRYRGCVKILAALRCSNDRQRLCAKKPCRPMF